MYMYLFEWIYLWFGGCMYNLFMIWVGICLLYIYFEILFILVLLKNKVLFIWWFCLELLGFLVGILNIFCRFGGFIILMVDIVLKYLLRFWFLKLKL